MGSVAMRSRRAKLAFLLLAGSSLLLAADFWEIYHYTQWTDEQIRKIMRDSPWAQITEIRLKAFHYDGELEPFDQPVLTTATVRWQSALPIRQIVALERYGDEADSSLESVARLGSDLNAYVVGVFGIPVTGGLGPPGDLAAGASLVFRDGSPLGSALAVVEQRDEWADVYFAFPNTPPDGREITLEDERVQFVLETVTIEVSHRFNLKNMVYLGKLGL